MEFGFKLQHYNILDADCMADTWRTRDRVMRSGLVEGWFDARRREETGGGLSMLLAQVIDKR